MAARTGQAAEEGHEPETSDKFCETCHEAAARYRCPSCDMRTCSLQCSKAHKEATGCTGKRSRTGFVPLSEFDERVLLSDYRFLEEAAALGDVAKRVAPADRRALPPVHVRELVQQARMRGVSLHLQHPGMERRTRNSSTYRRAKGLCWHVEWRFPAADFVTSDKRVFEGRALGELLAAHLQLAPGGAEKVHRLREYADAGADGLTIVMRQELRPANDPAYYVLPAGLPLGAALRGKVLVEFPVLAVLLPRELPSYKIIVPPPRPPSCPPPAPTDAAGGTAAGNPAADPAAAGSAGGDAAADAAAGTTAGIPGADPAAAGSAAGEPAGCTAAAPLAHDASAGRMVAGTSAAECGDALELAAGKSAGAQAADPPAHQPAVMPAVEDGAGNPPKPDPAADQSADGVARSRSAMQPILSGA